MENLVFATQNRGKLLEICDLLQKDYNIVSLADIGCIEELPETHDTLLENSLEKAYYVYNTYNINCFADDSGLEVEALNGLPGVYSARYAGEEKNPEANMDKLLFELKDKLNRNARFKTVIALILDGNEYVFEGSVEGTILKEKKGTQGFGYDPVFQPLGYNKSFAEMTVSEKASMSHRAIAVRKLVQFLKK